ncbi:MAG: ATP-dependent DNA helicase RecG, partial [Atopostipes suicloacalis]|nr:ATP-dependent DNA helicase RecG [Atopostipes suicloacalis]
FRKQLSGIKIIVGNTEEHEKFEPIYHSSKEISHNIIRKLVKQAWDSYHQEIKEIASDDLIKKYHLLSSKEAIFNMHFPETEEIMDTARQTIIFLEFFLFQIKAQYRKVLHKNVGKGRAIHYQLDYLKDFFASLPFELTNAQKKAVNSISADMKRPIQLYRLLQGDVGSGKTVVAAGAIVAAQSTDLQSALMAPTEILAEQHFISLQKFYQSFNIRIELLTGSTKTKKRQEILDRLKAGEIDLLVGTHALIQEDLQFKDLALVIIDEQHRFGVNQRKLLREKGKNPDVLFMTATPIPRTLSITAYGEMDVSVIDEMPPGRLPVETHWIRRKSLAAMMNELKKELISGAQAYVISPLIEESDLMDLENAEELFLEYKDTFSSEYKVSLLHGRMNTEEKEKIMEQFKNNQINILVSTTVIEVGVDVPNASMMIIHNADRFGLAQLHQLRGRVGRGERQSRCILIANPKSENGVERMKIMTETTDGFKISQKDLEMRGPGEFFGKKQSGLVEFKVADILEDKEVLEFARYEAEKILTCKEFLKSEDYLVVRRLVGIEDGQIHDILD